MPKTFNVSIVYHASDDVRLMIHYETRKRFVHIRHKFSNIDEL